MSHVETRIGFLRKLGWLGLGIFAAKTIRVESVRADGTPTAKDVRGYGAKGDGQTDDTAAFRRALEASGAIQVPADAGLRFLIGGVEVDGRRISGGGTIVKRSGSPAAFIAKGDGAVFEGLRFEAQKVSGQPNCEIQLGDGARNVRMVGCSFESDLYSAIAADANGESDRSLKYKKVVSGVIITQCVFKGPYSRPLYLHSVEDITIQGNIFRDCRYDAIRLRQNDGFCLIDGNQFLNIGTADDADTKDAVDTHWSGRVLTITNNLIRGTGRNGLDIKGVSPDGKYATGQVIIANNQIHRAKYSGIFISCASKLADQTYRPVHGFLIRGNIIQECNQSKAGVGEAAIFLRNGVAFAAITDNYVASNFARGIFVANLEKGAPKTKSVRISGNICVNNGIEGKPGGAGVMTSGIDQLIVSENICENDPALPNPFQEIGIHIAPEGNGYRASEPAIVRDNRCRGNLKLQISTDAKIDA